MESRLWNLWMESSHQNHFSLTWSISGYGSSCRNCENRIWPVRWLSPIPTTISTIEYTEIKLIHSRFEKLLNRNSVYLQKQTLVLRLLIYSSRFPPIWINKVAVLTRSIFHKGLIGDEILWLCEVHVTHTRFLYKIHNLLMIMNRPKTEYEIISIFKDMSDID